MTQKKKKIIKKSKRKQNSKKELITLISQLNAGKHNTFHEHKTRPLSAGRMTHKHKCSEVTKSFKLSQVPLNYFLHLCALKRELSESTFEVRRVAGTSISSVSCHINFKPCCIFSV
ncbi:unnamed protein product [Ceratitis capitata]|uniref:(Mediterranean fruit fly) hypothetical protein n=1 Tax=Ceratitis capitata TaxID=7213 RepID=A0A811UJT3_CERCA|nr:unnamed protein product [Ceratitis capitata]